MKPLNLDDAYEDLARKVIADVPQHSVQWKESRKMFFSGVATLFYHITGQVTRVSDEDGEAELSRIDKQLREFFEMVKEEKD